MHLGRFVPDCPDLLRASWGQIGSTALRCGEVIRQEPREERIGNTVERGDAAGTRRNATRRAGVFCVVGSSKGLPVFPDTGCALLLPTPQNPSGAVVQSGPNLLYPHKCFAWPAGQA